MNTFEERVNAARRVLAGGMGEQPGWFVDQAQAAERETWGRLFPAMATGVAIAAGGARLQATSGDGERGRAVQALLVAAACACVPCPHLRRARAPMPTVVALGLRRIACERCARTVVNPPVGDEDRCDVCGTHGIRAFHPFTVAMGAGVVIGDACATCATRLGFSS